MNYTQQTIPVRKITPALCSHSSNLPEFVIHIFFHKSAVTVRAPCLFEYNLPHVMDIEDKITIIEGPPPTFEEVNDGWALGLHESPNLSGIVVTRLRTFNGPALIERCYRTWSQRLPMYLEYRTMDGLQESAPIVAARTADVLEGQMIILWVVQANNNVRLELGYDDDSSDDIGDDDIDDTDPFDDLDEGSDNPF